MRILDSHTAVGAVAPARERGLKWQFYRREYHGYSRSREGAWIEIEKIKEAETMKFSRSREGAWIEIHLINNERRS